MSLFIERMLVGVQGAVDEEEDLEERWSIITSFVNAVSCLRGSTGSESGYAMNQVDIVMIVG